MHCVIGPNGAGKSTLIKAITGDAKLFGGRIFVEGLDVTGWDGSRLPELGVGWVPQLRDTFSTLTVRENLEVGGYLLSRKVRQARIDEVIEVFPRLSQLLNRQTSKLSGGERKLVALGRALMPKPKILLLDEPTASLSPEMSNIVLNEYLGGVTLHGVAVLMIEQRAVDALMVAEWAYVMIGGRLRVSAPAADLRSRTDLGQLFLGASLGDFNQQKLP